VLGEGATISTSTDDTTQLSIQLAGESTEPALLHAAGAFHGVVYGPGREIELAPAFELFGALVGRQLTFTGPVRLHFDRHLLAAASEAALPRLVSWRIVDLASPNTGALGRDPFAILGVDRATLPRPAFAHADQWLDLVYENGYGAEAAYHGMESGFDWSVVGEVLRLERDGDLVRGRKTPALSRPALEGMPETSRELLSFLATYPAASQSEVRDALMAAAPLDSSVLQAVMARDPQLSLPNLVDVLIASSPLSAADLSAALTHTPPIQGPSLTRLLAAQ
jgi:hypothetical protein